MTSDEQAWPFVTVVIAARPDQPEVPSVRAARELDYPGERMEILVARGRQPSAQRNQAVREARGELIYFLDDDSKPRKDSLRRAVAHFRAADVVMAGGPNLCPADAPWIEQAFALVMASWLAFGPSAARYKPSGRARSTSEKELILCNLTARRRSFLDLGGFDEALYPNEENALMDELRQRGGRLIYDPEMVVYRRPRGTLKAFIRMLFNYGRGRAEQFRLHPSFGSALNFAPPVFLVYLLLLPRLPLILWPPLAIYCLAVLFQTLALAVARPTTVIILPWLLAMSHVAYGAGFWRGLCTRLKVRPGTSAIPPKIERL